MLFIETLPGDSIGFNVHGINVKNFDVDLFVQIGIMIRQRKFL